MNNLNNTLADIGDFSLVKFKEYYILTLGGVADRPITFKNDNIHLLTKDVNDYLKRIGRK